MQEGSPVGKMKTMQGVRCRRRSLGRFALLLAGYTLVFIVFIASCRVLFADSLSAVIADATSVWVSVPESSADLYRMLGMQEGAMANGMYQFRDLSDYHAVVDFIEGPLVWGAYLLGIIVISAISVRAGAQDVDDVVWALSKASAEDGSLVVPSLPVHLDAAQGELDRLRERINIAFRAASAAETRKNELVAYLAHDIKTPLTSVIGYLALLSEEPDLPAEKRERFAASALDKARRLDGMMDEFFEITRYNLGSIPIERERIDAVMLAEQVADECTPMAIAHGVYVIVRASGSQVEAFIDPDKMARVIGNLLKNAISFADIGTEVAVEVALEGSQAVFKVEDIGREISDVHLKHIFEKFYRADDSRSSGNGGAGLGLAIAREIVSSHGGKIDAKSEGGRTVFTVSVPAFSH